MPFTFRNRVRYSEVDPQSVVFNARYLDYADLGITEYFRAMREGGLWPTGADAQFHVRRAEVDFLRPLFADEEFDIAVSTSATGRTSVTNLVELTGLDRAVRARIVVVAVHVDLSDHRPRPLPDWYAPMLRSFDARFERSGSGVPQT